MSNDLIKWGLRQNKTFTCKFPNLPKHLIRHFIRGYFDGDGSIFVTTIRTKPTAYCTMLGNKQFLQKLITFFPFKLYSNISIAKSVFSITIGRRESLIAFYRWIYSDSTVFLNRKYDKWNVTKNILARGVRCVTC